jgi:preprotein translocase subunit SecA
VNLPAADYQRVTLKPVSKLPRGLDAVSHALVGAWQNRAGTLPLLVHQASIIGKSEDRFRFLSDRRLREALADARLHFRRRRSGMEALTLEALAAIREVSARQLGLHPFPVQMMGSLALHQGRLAEMATGEGKSLTAAIAAVLAGWTGAPCHIVTVNDYLAQRDAHWFAPLYRFCGVSVGCVTSEMDPPARQQAYAKEVTYTTSKELLADFLRDRIRIGRVAEPERRALRHVLQPRLAAAEGLVLRGLHAAIVDEADSVLIDEAVTPLIIARHEENPLLKTACTAARLIADQLTPVQDFTVNQRYRETELTAEGKRHVERIADTLPPAWRNAARRRELIEQSLVARAFFLNGRQYVVQDGQIVIVDEFTGRIMPNRSWSEGLHQAIEVKEGLPPSEPDVTLARLSFQRFFRQFRHLSGMTGTAREAASELWRIYALPVVTIPTNRPCLRKDLAGRYFADAESKWQAVAETGGLHVIATEQHESGRIDRQLFGRCARQGDPGSTRAFVSAEDDLLQRFLPGKLRSGLFPDILGRCDRKLLVNMQ